VSGVERVERVEMKDEGRRDGEKGGQRRGEVSLKTEGCIDCMQTDTVNQLHKLYVQIQSIGCTTHPVAGSGIAHRREPSHIHASVDERVKDKT